MDESNNQIPQQQDNVWISREEYLRLKQEAAAASYSAPVAVGESYENNDLSSKEESRWTMIGLTVLGVLTLLAFTTSIFSFTAPLLLTLLLLAGAASLVRALRFKGAPQTAKTSGGAKKTVVLVLLLVGVLLIAPQFMMMIFMLIFMLPLMVMTGGRGT